MTRRDRRPRDRRSSQAAGSIKTFGSVVGLDGADLDLYPGEVLAVIGDNGAGKSTLIKCLSGADGPRRRRDPGRRAWWSTSSDAAGRPRRRDRDGLPDRSPSRPPSTSPRTCSSAARMRRRDPSGSVLRMLDHGGDARARRASSCSTLGIAHDPEHHARPSRPCPAGSARPWRSPGPRRSGARSIILDEPTAALGVKESGQVLELIRDLRERGLPVILISHNMPHVFEVADRIHIQRLGRRIAVVTPAVAHHVRRGGDHDRRPRRIPRRRVGALGGPVGPVTVPAA